MITLLFMDHLFQQLESNLHFPSICFSSELFESKYWSGIYYLPIYLLKIFIRFVSKLHMSLLYWVCKIGMQGPQLCAKPRHFCKLDVATSRMACLTYMFYNLPLTIQTIEGALWYKIAPLTPPRCIAFENCVNFSICAKRVYHQSCIQGAVSSVHPM